MAIFEQLADHVTNLTRIGRTEPVAVRIGDDDGATLIDEEPRRASSPQRVQAG